MRPVTSALRELDGVRPLYEVPRDDIASQLLIPAMNAASRVEIMAGFFSSRAFAQLAPGLAAFIQGTNEPLHLLISPRISDEDREAIARAVADPEAVLKTAIERLFDGAQIRESAIAAHVADCLAYLVARERIVIRFVLMEQGMFHPKVWLFESDGDVLAVHGSSNPTEAGLLYNGETVSVDKPWADGPAAQDRVAQLRGMFQDYWHNRRPHAITIEAPAGLMFAGDHDVSHVPTVDDFWRAWFEDAKKGLAPPLPEGTIKPFWLSTATDPQQLGIPGELVWETGRFAHQGAAVRAWEAHGRQGVLAIATGGGKTISSFIGATRLQDESERPLLVVVLVPSDPLVDQWSSETERFGIRPHILGRLAANERLAVLHGLVSGLLHGVSKTEVLICSNQLFTGSATLRDFLRGLPTELRVLLIADEVHNLGSPSFLADPPTTIPYRLGLSATPIRQYDADGTNELFAYFGEMVFEFDLGQAIAAGCLRPYRYYLHEVQLSDEEMETWQEITERLRRQGFRASDDGQTGGLDPGVQRLLEKRRAVLENAGAKIAVLRKLLIETPPPAVTHSLIYTSAKSDPLGRGRQIIQVNQMLNDLGIISHQLTYTETGGRKAKKILAAFAAGEYQSLTCMKVLDEGVDVPATATAYLLASSTVRREWVQRRGRVLRVSAGKDIAHLHDFFVVPPDPTSAAGRSILHGELARADEFCRLAENAWDNDGPRSVTERYE